MNEAFDKTGVERLEELARSSVAEIQTEIRRRCLRRIGHRGGRDIDAAVQEIMVILLKRRTQLNFDPIKGNFWGFVNGVINKICIGVYRNESREKSLKGLEFRIDAPTTHSGDPVQAAIDSEIREAILAAAVDLTPTEREALARLIDRVGGGRPTLHPEISTEHVQEFRVKLKLRKLLAKFVNDVN